MKEQFTKENMKQLGIKVAKGAAIGIAGIAIGAIGIKVKSDRKFEQYKEGYEAGFSERFQDKADEMLAELEAEMKEAYETYGKALDVENMSDKEYVRHLHRIEVIPDEVMHYVENIEQENAILKQEVEELSIDKQELKETIDLLDRDIEDLEAQILGHEK